MNEHNMQKQTKQVEPEVSLGLFEQASAGARNLDYVGTKYFVNPQSSACHQAGHAVAAWYHNIDVKLITIKPASDALGRAQHPNPLQGVDTAWDTSTRARIRMERLVSVCLAGPLAQRKFSLVGFRRSHAEDDWQQAVDLLSYFVVSHEELEAYFRLLQIQTQNLLSLDFVWQNVLNLATVLLKRETLSGAEANRIIEETIA